jgi:hypothetical protein
MLYEVEYEPVLLSVSRAVKVAVRLAMAAFMDGLERRA